MDKDRKPDAVMMRRVKGTTYVVSSFFNQDSKETAADKMARLIEREAGLGTSVNKNLVNCKGKCKYGEKGKDRIRKGKKGRKKIKKEGKKSEKSVKITIETR